MSKRTPTTIHITTTGGEEIDLWAKRIEDLCWANGEATLTVLVAMTDREEFTAVMDLPTYNALVADWALSAPGRTRGLQFAIRANAKAGRLTGTEQWPRNKP